MSAFFVPFYNRFLIFGKIYDIFHGPRRRFAWFVVVLSSLFLISWIVGPGHTFFHWAKAAIEVRRQEKVIENYEAENAEETLSQWEMRDTPAYGYWAMLKRIGKAQGICGCEEHELLMPIPKEELIYNRNLTQNPGY